MKAVVDNILINYNVVGSGNAILFLHGWQDNLHTFDKIIDILKDNYMCISIDIPGFGLSSDPDDDWHLDDYILFVDKFIKKINVDIFAMVGHSFGCRIIIKGVANKILLPKKIILISAAGIVDKSYKKNVLMIISKFVNIFFKLPFVRKCKNILRHKFYKLIRSDYYNAKRLKKIFLNIINEDLQKYSKIINIPTLIIWGVNDKITPLSFGIRFHQLIKNSKLIEIQGEDHFVHHKKYYEVAEDIKNFLQ